MQRSPTYLPTSARPPSIDSLCVSDDEGISLNAGHEISSSSSTTATPGVSQKNSVRDLIVLPPASDPTTKLGATGLASPSNQPRPPVWKTSFLRDRWLWEITCLIFSIACVIAVTILSSRLDGTWLSKWTFPLQPSTTLSILATTAQSSMMLVVAEVLSQLKWLQISLSKAQSVVDFTTLDSASRGPLGSLKLFYSWKPRSKIPPLMGYTASLITIGALAMGPFTQQIISIKADNLVPTDGMNSTIAVSNYYNTNSSATGLEWWTAEDGRIMQDLRNARAVDVDPDIQGSFYNGYYNLGKSFLDLNCPSSNCSWDIFSSLGVCSTCQDVTEATKVFPDPLYANGVGPPIFLTPGGWVVDKMDSDTQVRAIANNSFATFTLDAFSASVVSLVIFQRSSDNAGHDYTVTECSINWCAKHYSNVTVINGTLQQHHSVREVPLWPVAGQDLGGLASGRRTSGNWDLMLTSDPDGGNISSPLPPFDHSGFNVSVYDFEAVTGLLAEKFTFRSASPTALFGNRQNVTSTLTNITNSMTNSIMRSNSESAALGIIWRLEPSIHVQWGWIALPLALVSFSAILLALMIVTSQYYDAPHWKSSPLPFLFHGIRNSDGDEELDLVEGRLESVHVMEKRARSKRVQIIQSPKGGRWLA